MIKKLFFIVIFILGMRTVAITGPLTVHPGNNLYLSDGKGPAIYLAGFEFWDSLAFSGGLASDGITWNQYLSAVAPYSPNCVRVWLWSELSKFSYPSYDVHTSKAIWQRPGPGTALDGLPKWDLSQFNQSYFDELRQRVIAAGNLGMYAVVMLGEGHATVNSDSPWNWDGHPFNSSNNINSIDGGDGSAVHTLASAASVTIQENYINKVIDTLNDLNNVVYEIGNEFQPGTANDDWQEALISHIKSYESGKAKQHLVLRSVQSSHADSSDQTTKLFSSGADIIAPGPYETTYTTDPPVATGNRVVLSDTDHLWGMAGNSDWVWKNFMRGNHVLNYMELPELTDGATHEEHRASVGQVLSYVNKINLSTMTPSTSTCSTQYCMNNAGEEYLAYQPSSGNFTISMTAGTYDYEIFRPSTGAITSTGRLTVPTGNNTIMSSYYPSVYYFRKVPPTSTAGIGGAIQ